MFAGDTVAPLAGMVCGVITVDSGNGAADSGNGMVGIPAAADVR